MDLDRHIGFLIAQKHHTFQKNPPTLLTTPSKSDIITIVIYRLLFQEVPNATQNQSQARGDP